MADHRSEETEVQPLVLLGIDALAFLIRNRTVFLLSTLPIAGLAAIIAWLVSSHAGYDYLRGHWAWDFLFALIYVMFLDRWMKETLLDDAAPCDEVDELRRSIVSPRLLVIAAAFFLLALGFGILQVQGVAENVAAIGLPEGLAQLLTATISWLPHIFVWSMLVSPFVLLLPACSGVKPMTLRGALALGRPIRSKLFNLVFGTALAWLLITSAAAWGLQVLPAKPWAASAMAAALRLAHCLVIAQAGYVVATLWRQLTDWQPPEPSDRTISGIGLRTRKA